MFAGLLRRGDVLGARIDTALPARQPLPRADLRQYQVALGPVAVFGASNFPLAFSTAGGDTASALAAGCPVVVKAHPGHMATAEQTAQAIVRAVEKCALPGGVFNMIFGTDIGAELVRHPAIQAVGFTGSLTGGKALLQLAQQRPQPIPLFAEMSAINPLIILPQALAARAASLAKDLVASFTLGGGQFCTRPGLILALKGEGLTRFTAALCEQVQAAPLRFCSMRRPCNTIAPVSRRSTPVRVCSGWPAVKRPAASGRRRCCTWRRRRRSWRPDSVLQTEVFGPLSVLVEVADETQMMALVSTLQGQLTATLHADADDRPLAARLLPAAQR